MSPSHPVVSVVVPNWNGRGFLPACLGSLRRVRQPAIEVIVVDNGSTDGSVDVIRREYPDVRLVTLTENHGFARANNAGFLVSRAPYVATLNNDAEGEPEWLGALVEAAEGDARIGMCAPKILSVEARDVIDSVGLGIARDGTSRGRGRLERDRGQYDRQEEILFPSACAALYRRAMLDDIGWFDESFFAYCEDSDLGLRARLAGWRAVYVPRARVYHRYSGTGGGFSSLKGFLVERNRAWVVAKNFPTPLWVGALLWTLVRYGLQAYGALAGRGAVGRLVARTSLVHAAALLVHANLAALRRLPGVLRTRRVIQRRRRVSVREVAAMLRTFRLPLREVALKS